MGHSEPFKIGQTESVMAPHDHAYQLGDAVGVADETFLAIITSSRWSVQTIGYNMINITSWCKCITSSIALLIVNDPKSKVEVGMRGIKLGTMQV
eukprot:6181101-Pleurochrysis_carterae.AAC.1